MKEKDPFDQMLNQITELLDMVHEANAEEKKLKKIDPSINKQLDELEESIALFKEITDKAIKRSGIDGKQMEKTIKFPEKELSSDEQKILKKARKVKGELDALAKEFGAQAIAFKKKQEKKGKKAGKARQKKFKRLGGQGWMPL